MNARFGRLAQAKTRRAFFSPVPCRRYEYPERLRVEEGWMECKKSLRVTVGRSLAVKICASAGNLGLNSLCEEKRLTCPYRKCKAWAIFPTKSDMVANRSCDLILLLVRHGRRSRFLYMSESTQILGEIRRMHEDPSDVMEPCNRCCLSPYLLAQRNWCRQGSMRLASPPTPGPVPPASVIA